MLKYLTVIGVLLQSHHSSLLVCPNYRSFVRRRTKILSGKSYGPPGFNPVVVLDSVVTYLAVVFENDNTFLEGLGIAMSFGRDDENEGMFD